MNTKNPYYWLVFLMFTSILPSMAYAGEAQKKYFSARYKEGQGLEVYHETKTILDLQTVEVKEQRDGLQNVAVIPISALLQTVTGDYVYVVNGNYYLRTKVETGVVSEGNIQISAGLFAGDEVVVRPVNSLWYAELHALRAGKACADGH